MEKRASFGSRLGFILVSAGCAIGIGNVWRFPTLCGESGGGVFVLFYLLVFDRHGHPDFDDGAGRGPRRARQRGRGVPRAGAQGFQVALARLACLAGCCMLMMYYTTVNGWMMDYCFKYITGAFEGTTPKPRAALFSELLANPLEMGFWTVLTVVLGLA